jgi:hypothetical protein
MALTFTARPTPHTYGATTGRILMARLSGLTATGGALSTAVASYGNVYPVPLANALKSTGMDLSSPNGIRVPVGGAGEYDLTCTIPNDGGAASERSIDIKVNGGSTPVLSFSGLGGAKVRPQLSGIIDLVDGDVVTASFYSAAATTITAGAPADVQLTLVRRGSVPVTPATVGWTSDVHNHGVLQNLIGTYFNRNSWADLSAGNYINLSTNGYGVWLNTPGNLAKAADIACPLIPTDSLPQAQWNTLLDEGASGTQDATYTAMGGKLAQYGPKTVYARLWWEMNQFSANVDSTKFITCWNHAVPLIRAGFAAAARPGQTLNIVYCYLASVAQKMTYYPGDATVDIVGADIYDQAYQTTTPTVAQSLANAKALLQELAVNGALHGKPVALGEWGCWVLRGNQGTADTQGRGDNPAYMDLVFDWIEQNNVAYAAYFDITQSGGLALNDTPLSLARFQARASLLANPLKVIVG